MNPLTHRYLSQKFVSVFIVVIILVVNGITLMRFPKPHGDEAWMASRASEFLQSGTSFGALDRGVFDRYEDYEYFNPWLSTAIQSIGVLIIGSPSLFAIRFVSLVVGLILLCSIYMIGFALDGRQLGLLAILFTAFSWPFLVSAHIGRSDIIAAAFGFTSIAFFLNNKYKNLWLGVLSGLSVSLAIEVHPHAIIYSITVLALFFYRERWNLFKASDFWGFIFGGFLGLLFYLGIHIYPNPQTYLRLTQLGYSFTRTPPLLTANFSIIRSAFTEQALVMVYSYPQVILGVWAIIRYRKSRTAYITTLLLISAVLLVSFALLIRNKFFYYNILFSPGLSLLFAGLFNDLLKSPIKRNFELYLRYFIIISFILLPVIKVISFDSVKKYQQVQAEVTQAVKPDDTIMGNQLYWFGLQDNEYLSWENLVFDRRDRPNSDLESSFKALHPDILILDSQLRNFVFDEVNSNMYFQELSISKSELEKFLSKYATLETKIDEGFESSLQIYRIHWPN